MHRMPFQHQVKSVLALLVLALGLGACATPPPPQFPEITFTHLPTIALGVARIEVVDNTSQTSNATYVDGLMPVAPGEALRNWSRDRLRASGVSGVAKFIIQKAEVTETNLERTTGLKGVFTKDQAQRYDAGVKVEIRLEGVPRVTQAFAETEVTHSQTIAEDATLNNREQMWFDLTETVMKEFDPAMSASIRKHLGDLVR